jgi:hypothetical protein
MNNFTTLFSLSVLTLLACGGDLNVGNGPGGSDASNGNVVGSGGCKASDCSAYAITCSSGQPSNLQCVPDSMISGCTLTGQCTDTTATQTCTYTPPPANCGNNSPCAGVSGIPGGGEIDLSSDTTTSTTTLTVNLGDSSSETIGACTYEPTGAGSEGFVEGQPLTNEGTVTASAAGFTLSDAPLCDGSYPTATTNQLVDQGAVVTFSWSGVPETPNPTFPNIPAPHAISVTEPGTLSASGTTLLRANDAPLAWTPLEPPLSLEQVGFELIQGPKRLECRFTSSDNAGIVPADALLDFAAGTAQFRMFSVHVGATDGIQSTAFVVMRQATFSDGPAVSGTLTLQ